MSDVTLLQTSHSLQVLTFATPGFGIMLAGRLKETAGRFRRSVKRRGFAGTAGVAMRLVQLNPIKLMRTELLKRRGGEPPAALAHDASVYWSEDTPANIDLREYSHWKGYGIFAAGTRWDDLGGEHLRMVKQLASHVGFVLPLDTAVEWGCGGGLNAVCFTGVTRRFYGIDVTQANLDECAHQMKESGFDDFRPVLIDLETPEQALDQIDEPCQLFFSTYVYQSFPGIDYARRVTEIGCKLLEPGGVALIQIVFDDGSPQLSRKNVDYDRNAVHFTTLKVEEFWQLAEGAGFEPLYVSLIPPGEVPYPHTEASLAYFALRKPIS